MTDKSIQLTKQLYDYMLSVSLREGIVLKAIRDFTKTLSSSKCLLTPEQGQFLALLVKIINAKQILEIGTYTGYSSTAMALALPDDGQLICCDIAPAVTQYAQQFWQQANVDKKIVLHSMAAIDCLNNLNRQQQMQFDLIFIDADKGNYYHYYQLSLPLLKTNGLMIFDNTLWRGLVADTTNSKKSTILMRAFNDKLYHDERVDISIIPIGDGMTLLRKI